MTANQTEDSKRESMYIVRVFLLRNVECVQRSMFYKKKSITNVLNMGLSILALLGKTFYRVEKKGLSGKKNGSDCSSQLKRSC